MNRSTRRTFLNAALSVTGLASVAAFSSSAVAQSDYPSRPITIVVPHAPGGAVDSTARLFADKLKDELKQSVVVENRAGASGMIGAAHVARAEPDGYTLYFNASIHAINPLLYKKNIKFDAVKDFTPISMLAQGALIFSVNPHVPAQNVRELVSVLKAQPDKYTFVTSGFGSAGHLGAAQFLHEAGLTGNIPIVLYKGAAPALQDLVGGQVSAMMDPMLSSLPHVKAGKLRALAVTGRERSPLLPDVPTMRESGFKDFEFYSWYGLWSPAKVPPAVVAKLDAASAKIMASPEIRERLASLGFESAYKNSADFAKYIESEMNRYQKIIDAAKITVE
ncbi:MAG: tripartite tricarboxylate transporter substrate binding protein [Pigmentiphaga sp.]|uniref:Bug family tripartite tricarboxylate transporter substrate binding protein n=1 Tax=Pigmentiphaga sp. TaxID=1977564 RepID=UPI0029B1E9B3|nr:tripartite tricarboxylate transporter substrate binding protein [Pigmentiphaga sp.]MDX3904493.1 tripartite tricarboxylate transporter substrate binding protein [Pigmentiphaga sp.]